jgi:hypothetical protein
MDCGKIESMNNLSENTRRGMELTKLLEKNGFLKYEIGIAIVDLNDPHHEIFGYNMDHFIYPASVYKIFIGAEMLRRIELGDFSLNQEVVVKSPNDVDKDSKIFPGDSRELLQVGDTATIDYLLDLMLTRSDNSASNCLIDLVGRESISENIIYKYGWYGSEVTRKFLDRIKEDKSYQFSKTTKTCARHTTEFMYMIETNQLISPFVSQSLKNYMLRWNRSGRGGLSLPQQLVYRKGGYLENNLYKNFYGKNGFGFESIRGLLSLVKSIFTKGWAFICWVNDVAVVTGNKSHYVISVFTVSKQLNPRKQFPMKKLSETIYDYMENNI